MNVLLISTNAVGDTYLSASAVPSLAAVSSNLQVDCVAGEHSRLLSECVPVRRWFFLPSRTPAGLWETVAAIRAESYDAAFCFFPGIVNTLLFRLADAKLKSGFVSALRRREWHNRRASLHLVGTKSRDYYWNPDMPFFDRVYEALKAIEPRIPYPRKIHLDVSDSIESYSNNIVLHFLSKEENKSLRFDAGMKLATMLSKECNLDVTVIGRDGQLASAKIVEADRIKTRVNLSLSQLVGLIRGSRLFIGVDSFPLHLADAHTGRMVGLFGPTRPGSVLEQTEKGIGFQMPSLQSLSAETVFERLKPFLPHE